jgi:hypothetical protein
MDDHRRKILAATRSAASDCIGLVTWGRSTTTPAPEAWRPEMRPPLIVAHLGPVPDEPAARDRWITAACRIAQHRPLWRVAGDVSVGPPPLDGRSHCS